MHFRGNILLFFFFALSLHRVCACISVFDFLCNCMCFSFSFVFVHCGWAFGLCACDPDNPLLVYMCMIQRIHYSYTMWFHVLLPWVWQYGYNEYSGIQRYNIISFVFVCEELSINFEDYISIFNVQPKDLLLFPFFPDLELWQEVWFLTPLFLDHGMIFMDNNRIWGLLSPCF